MSSTPVNIPFCQRMDPYQTPQDVGEELKLIKHIPIRRTTFRRVDFASFSVNINRKKINQIFDTDLLFLSSHEPERKVVLDINRLLC